MRSRIFVFAAVLALGWAWTSRSGAATPCYIGTYADPMHCDINTFTGGDIYMVDVWVWVQASDVGLKAIEFSLEYPTAAAVFPGETYTNPAIVVWMGDLQDGVSASFGACQTGWVWTHRQVFYVFSAAAKGFFRIDGHPIAEPYFKQYASCEAGHPIYPLSVSNHLALNQCAYICGCWPRIQNVQPLTHSKLRVDFGTCVNAYGDPYTGNFHLFADGSAVEALDVVASERISDAEFVLTLDGSMIEGTEYVLVAQDMVECEVGCPWVESSSRKFLFDAPVATLLQAHDVRVVDGSVELEWTLSDIDPGAAFIVSRSKDGEAYEGLAGAPSEVARLSYRYVDSSVEPGREYVYSVEYSSDDEKRLLFISGKIAVPAARLTLHQNVPNPFNPATTIAFTLPGAAAVNLEIFDVSGHLVARLLDGERLPGGTHAIDWNGSDGAGNPVNTGIYFYRLRAGKTIVSRKMILLR